MTEIFAKEFGWRPFYESVADNPYLKDFYQGMKRWSFNLQIYFLFHSFKSHKLLSEVNFSGIKDRTMHKDIEIFTRNLYEKDG